MHLPRFAIIIPYCLCVHVRASCKAYSNSTTLYVVVTQLKQVPYKALCELKRLSGLGCVLHTS